MSDMTQVARPYARAAFELAQAQDTLQAWDDELALLATIADDARVRAVLADPRVDRSAKSGLVLDIAEGHLTAEVCNFVKLLAENGRLPSLPAVRTEFAALKAETEKRVVARSCRTGRSARPRKGSCSRPCACALAVRSN
jgi:F-type H+-transporting ATPase subunit delta